MNEKHAARLASHQEDYQYLKLSQEIVPWEDGHRTNGKFGEYEWWYFDAKLEDGSSLVIVFYSQPVTAADFSYAPSMTFSLTKDGSHFTDSKAFSIQEYFFDKSRCRVKLGKSIFEGDLHTYNIHYETDRVQADIVLTANSAPWRPETGYFLFGKKDYFAWLPSVPEGDVKATITIDGQTHILKGTGYHDHNWGNKGMFWLMHHWYWGRAKVGEYQIISSYITSRQKYGYEHFPIFLLLKNGKKLGDDPRYITYSQKETAFDPVTQKHYHKHLVYDYNDGNQHYRVTYQAKEIIERFTSTDTKTAVHAKASPFLLWLVKQAGLAPSYIRMVGTVKLERIDAGNVLESMEAPGLWEQMYFGMDEDV